MRRIVAALLLTFAAAGADACSVSRNYERPVAFTQYDEAYLAWFAALADTLKRDADPEIAYAGYYLAEVPPNFNTAPPPPPPPESLQPAPDNEGTAPPEPPPVLPAATTGVARVLRLAYCIRNGRCDDDGVAAWMAVEPDNAFVLMQALVPKHRGGSADAERLLALATRYDDYFAALRALPAKIAARHDVTPPQAPPGYALPPCFAFDSLGIDALLDADAPSDPQSFMLPMLRDSRVAAATRLHAADLMIAAVGTPHAAEYGVRIGVAAASEPSDRERYCRLQARLRALPVTLAFGAEAAEFKRRYHAALETRSGLDAAETVARETARDAPANLPDEADIAACVARAPGDGISLQDLDAD